LLSVILQSNTLAFWHSHGESLWLSVNVIQNRRKKYPEIAPQPEQKSSIPLTVILMGVVPLTVILLNVALIILVNVVAPNFFVSVLSH